MKYFIIAGESSGDLHASNLIRYLKQHDPNAEFRGWGGEHMRSIGVQMLKTLNDLNFMGFIEVLTHLPKIIQNFKDAKRQILAFKPDVVILIDFPGFNLKLAKWLKKKQFKVVYYILPQVWAWKAKRVFTLHKFSDLLLSILPFEKDFFLSYGIHVEYVGHPLVEEIQEKRKDIVSTKSVKPILAIFPGSRKQEVIKLLPIMLKAARNFKNRFSIMVAGVSHLPRKLYGILQPDEELMIDDPHLVLASAKVAIVKSGTSTLQAALWGVPQVICYKASWLSYWIARWLVSSRIRFISLVNLIMNKEICPELIQHQCNSALIEEKIEQVLTNINSIKNDYLQLMSILGNQSASNNAAQKIMHLLSNPKK
ncbi:MAG: lipid-A-disaccharide synthase [Bacteroidales bacterium]|nr:lipid-A-disaccharide synthase [Bacteroidales bacterium]